MTLNSYDEKPRNYTEIMWEKCQSGKMSLFEFELLDTLKELSERIEDLTRIIKAEVKNANSSKS